MTPPISIRPYRQTDWPELCRIHDAARLIELGQTVGVEAFLDLAATAGPEGLFAGRLDVLECENRVRGFAAYSPDELTWLYVDPADHGRGFGRALLRHAIGNADPVFRTEVLEGNRAATALYLAEGFSVIERITGRLTGNEGFAATGLCLERRGKAAG